VKLNPNYSLVFNGTLAYLHAQLSLQNSTVGPVNVLLLEAIADLVLPILVASVNGDLAKGFPLPPIPGVSFTNTTDIQMQDNYAVFSADFISN